MSSFFDKRRTSNHGHARKRAKSNSKLKLVRSLAVCEESSTPFADGPLETQDIIQLHISCPSDKEEEKSTKDVSEKEDKDKKKKRSQERCCPETPARNIRTPLE